MENNLRIVVDANVVISSLLFGGKPREFLRTAVQRRITIYTSLQIKTEILEVLRKKFQFSEVRIKNFEKENMAKFVVVYPLKRISVVRDKDDNKILEAAVEGDCDYIVTGDKDLLVLKKYKNIQILTPMEFLELGV